MVLQFKLLRVCGYGTYILKEFDKELKEFSKETAAVEEMKQSSSDPLVAYVNDKPQIVSSFEVYNNNQQGNLRRLCAQIFFLPTSPKEPSLNTRRCCTAKCNTKKVLMI